MPDERPPAGRIAPGGVCDKLAGMNTNQLTVMDGGKKERERQRHLLFTQPWRFGRNEFEQLCERFDLSRAEAFDLTLMRIRHQAGHGDREAAAILALVEGDEKNAARLLARARREKLIKPVVSGKASPPR